LTSPASDRARSDRRIVAVVVSMLLATLAVAHFWRVAEFGLYEDDYYFVGEPIGWST